MKTLEQKQKALRLSAISVLAGLAAEFILGMYTALFVDMDSGAGASNPVVMVHATLGLILLALAVTTFINALRIKNRIPLVSSAIGLAMILISDICGTVFIMDPTKDAYSFIMALGILGAFISYNLVWNYARNPVKGA
jgi:heme A synthase